MQKCRRKVGSNVVTIEINDGRTHDNFSFLAQRFRLQTVLTLKISKARLGGFSESARRVEKSILRFQRISLGRSDLNSIDKLSLANSFKPFQKLVLFFLGNSFNVNK